MIALSLGLTLALEHVAMAKPPEPLEDVLPRAALIVEAEVVRVVSTDKDVPSDPDSPRQVVLLKVTRVLRGQLDKQAEKSAEILVTKPKAGYALRAGNRGPFLLAVDEKTDEKIILGRYGPDTWRPDHLEAVLEKLAAQGQAARGAVEQTNKGK